MHSPVFAISDRQAVARALLALALGPVVIAGALMLKNPDGDHFVGKMRDRIRVDRTLDQLDTLVMAIRQLVSQHPASASSNLMSALTQKQLIPGRMVTKTPGGPLVVLSPWKTKITVVSERGAFGITVLMSQFGCLKALASYGAQGVSVNGQRLKLPINQDSAVKNCRDAPIPEVTFWYSFDADGKR